MQTMVEQRGPLSLFYSLAAASSFRAELAMTPHAQNTPCGFGDQVIADNGYELSRSIQQGFYLVVQDYHLR